MKKTKLLIPILSITTLSSCFMSLTSCSLNKEHVWLANVDEAKKDADANLQAKYYFGLDSDKYESKDIEVKITSSNKDLLIVDYFVSGNILVVQVQFVGSVEEATPIKFNLKVSTKEWTQQINNLVINVPITDPEDLHILKKINKILSNNEKCNTMRDALKVVKDNGIDVENLVCKEENGIYVWDQSINRFAIISSIDGHLIYGTDGYVLNEKTWQLWKMVFEDEFDSYCQYSQYLKKSTTNALTKVDYSFIAGFDSGENTDVRNVHYFYEKDEDGQVICAKDIIINTNSASSNVDISAYNNGIAGKGDTVTHYGTMGELTVISNDKYEEKGTAVVCSVYEGEIKIDPAPANIELTYIKADVTLTDYKKTGSVIDEIYILPELPDEVKNRIKDEYPETSSEKTKEQYQEAKEEKYAEQKIPVTYIFDATDGKNTVHFNSLTEIATWSNTDHPAEAGKPTRTFEGWTITLNKDYDMSLECENWVPIGNDLDTYTNSFKGIFDGNGHSILNFNLYDTTSIVSLFGVSKGTIKNLNIVDSEHVSTKKSNPIVIVFLSGSATVDNVNLYNCKVKCNSSNGLFMWAADGFDEIKITNCLIDENSSIVNTAGANTAAFIGQCCGFTKIHLENLTNEASVTGISNVGGIIGQYGNAAGNALLKNCKNTGKITITSGNTSCYCGGLIGYLNSGSAKAGASLSFENCENSGIVTSASTQDKNTVCGGLYGFTNVFAITCTNCKNSGKIGLIEAAEGEYICNWAGGFSGFNNAANNTTEVFVDCVNEGTIYATNGIGHFATRLLGDQQYAQDCTIENGTLITLAGATRIQIPGEPN